MDELHPPANERLPFGLKWRKGQRPQRVITVEEQSWIPWPPPCFTPSFSAVSCGSQYVWEGWVWPHEVQNGPPQSYSQNCLWFRAFSILVNCGQSTENMQINSWAFFKKTKPLPVPQLKMNFTAWKHVANELHRIKSSETDLLILAHSWVKLFSRASVCHTWQSEMFQGKPLLLFSKCLSGLLSVCARKEKEGW